MGVNLNKSKQILEALKPQVQKIDRSTYCSMMLCLILIKSPPNTKCLQILFNLSLNPKKILQTKKTRREKIDFHALPANPIQPKPEPKAESPKLKHAKRKDRLLLDKNQQILFSQNPNPKLNLQN